MSYHVVEGTYWWAVRTRSNFERKVYEQLRSRSVESFFPTYQRKSRRKDRRVTVTAPLFTGYLFVREDLSELSRRVNILQVRGLVNLVGGPNGPLPIPDFEIDNVRRVCESGVDITPWDQIRRGTVVRVVSGGLEGVVGVVLELKDKKKRLVCNVEMLNRAVSAEVGADQIELVGESEYRELRKKLLPRG